MSSVSAVKREEDGGASAESKNSSAPLLSKATQDPNVPLPSTETDSGSAKPRKRDFWKLGKKQEEEKQKPKELTSSSPTHSQAPQIPPMVGLRPSSPFRISDPLAGSVSPQRTSHPSVTPGSPGQGITSVPSASPRPHSPASSMIFERNVQEEAHPPEVSPQIPAHVITENHIPPALDASAEAITNAKLDPDEVEIITHATHQPAAVTITGATAENSMASSTVDDMPPPASAVPRNSEPGPDDMSGYGSLDSGDVRRLSFISFADVVHAEQEGIAAGDQRRDSANIGSHAVLSAPRSPSPMRSPVSSQAFGTSPPTSIATSAKGFEGSPHQGMRVAGSPPLPGSVSPMGGELNIETMTQALRRTGSGDLSGARSAPMSAVGEGENFGDRAFR